MTNILVCDDEKDIVNAMKIYLEAEDYNVYTAFNGEQAVKTVLSVEIHLIIMDITGDDQDTGTKQCSRDPSDCQRRRF